MSVIAGITTPQGRHSRQRGTAVEGSGESLSSGLTQSGAQTQMQGKLGISGVNA